MIIELAARKALESDGNDSIGVGVQLQQAVGRHYQFTVEGFGALLEGGDERYGSRVEMAVQY